MMRVATAVLLVLLGNWAAAQPRPDSCRAQIPRSLGNALALTFPGYRTPLETDNAPEDIKNSQEHGGTGCLGVAIADFTGEGKKDYLLGLTALKGSAGLAVIAFPKKGGWSFRRIQSRVEDARYRQYVEVQAPGTYDRTGAITTPLGPGEKRSITCTHPVALVGAVESSGIAYCYMDGQWSHVRISD